MKKPYWQLIAKIALITLAVLAYGYIFHKLLHFEHWQTLSDSFKFSEQTIFIGSALVALWLVNLSCETKKWQSLMLPFYGLSFKKAWQQVMAGTTTAVGSPARIAEMGGRMALLPKEQRLNAGLMTALSGIIQNVVMLVMGIMALFFASSFIEYLQSPFEYLKMMAGIIILTFVITLIICFVFPNTFKQYFSVLRRCSKVSLLNAFRWTILRYITFVFQLYLWLLIWGLQLDLTLYMPLAALYFLLITVIPSHIFVDIGIRGSAAIFIFSSYVGSEPLVLVSTFCLWCSNVILPTIIGSFTLMRQKLIKQ